MKALQSSPAVGANGAVRGAGADAEGTTAGVGGLPDPSQPPAPGFLAVTGAQVVIGYERVEGGFVRARDGVQADLDLTGEIVLRRDLHRAVDAACDRIEALALEAFGGK